MLWEFKDSPITTWVTDSHCCSIDFAVLFDGIESEILWKQERSFDENTRTIWPLKMCKHTAMIRLYSFNQYVFFSLGTSWRSAFVEVCDYSFALILFCERITLLSRRPLRKAFTQKLGPNGCVSVAVCPAFMLDKLGIFWI